MPGAGSRVPRGIRILCGHFAVSQGLMCRCLSVNLSAKFLYKKEIYKGRKRESKKAKADRKEENKVGKKEIKNTEIKEGRVKNKKVCTPCVCSSWCWKRYRRALAIDKSIIKIFNIHN